MSTDNIVTLIAAGLAFLASLIAVIISAYNARFNRFASERWWERKAEAYTSIIDALSDLVYYYQQNFDSFVTQKELSEEKQREIKERWRKGNFEIKKATNIGAFLISPEAENALKKYWEEPTDDDYLSDWFERLARDYTKAENCLKELVLFAKQDLRVDFPQRKDRKSR